MESVQLQWVDIREYIAEVAQKDVKTAMKIAGKEGATFLKNNSPVAQNGRRKGRYARGWRFSFEEGAGRTGEVYIYNQTDWQLTHLLEDGHDIKNRFSKGAVIGHWNGDKHIAYAEGYVEGILQRSLRVSRGLY